MEFLVTSDYLQVVSDDFRAAGVCGWLPGDLDAAGGDGFSFDGGHLLGQAHTHSGSQNCRSFSLPTVIVSSDYEPVAGYSGRF